MTKTYDLIHINNHIYMVDKEAGNYPNANLITNPLNKGRLDEDKLYAIIASTDKSLGLPLLPDIEEKISEKGYNEEWFKVLKTINQNWKLEEMQAFNKALKGLWKAASAKKYTEEDMRRAFKAGDKHGREDINYTLGRIMTGMFNALDEDEYLQSLNPLPIQVEVEVYKEQENEEYGKNGDFSISASFFDIPKLNKNNFVQVVKYIYIYE